MKLPCKKITLFILMVSAIKVSACSCSYPFSEFTPQDLTIYSHIVACKPISAETRNNVIVYKAITIKSYWGTANDTLTIMTALAPGGCGFPLQFNENYLIYGTGDKEIHLSSCSPTRLLNKSRLWFSDNEQSDSLNISINGIYKKYSSKFLITYFEKAKRNEIKILEQLANTKNGVLKLYFTNDSLSGVITLKGGKLNDHSVFYYPDGKMHSEGKFTDNLKEGKWIENTFKIIRQKPYYFSSKGRYINNNKSGLWRGKMLIGNYEDFKHYSYAYKRNRY